MSRMTNLIVVSVLLLLVQTVLMVQGSCAVEPVSFDETTKSTYCMVGGHTRIEENTWLVTSECVNCTCQKDWLQCCGIGIRAGGIMIPAGYKMQLVPPCDYFFVRVTK